MKKVLKKDLRSVLPALTMMVVAAVLLECLILAGVAIKNHKFVATCITMGVLSLAISAMYHLFLTGSMLLRDLRNPKVFDELQKEGISKRRAIIFRMIYVLLSMAAFVVLYGAFLFADIEIFKAALPEAGEDLSKFGFRKMIQHDGEAFLPSLGSTVFEYITLLALLVILVYFTVYLAATVVLRYRFAGFGSVVMYLFFLGVLRKMYHMVTAGKHGIDFHMTAGGAQLLLCVVIFIAVMYMLPRKVLPSVPPKRPGRL